MQLGPKTMWIITYASQLCVCLIALWHNKILTCNRKWTSSRVSLLHDIIKLKRKPLSKSETEAAKPRERRHSHSCNQLGTLQITLWAVSSGSPPLIKMPLTAPTPVPTITAVGVARPSAHGQAIHSTEMAYLNDCSITNSWKLRPLYNDDSVYTTASANDSLPRSSFFTQRVNKICV